MSKKGFRVPTSLHIDPELWKQVKHAIIDLDIQLNDFFEDALKEKLKRDVKK